MRDTSGAVTVEWVMVAAVVVGLALATVLAVAQHTGSVADETAAKMMEFEVPFGDAQEASNDQAANEGSDSASNTSGEGSASGGWSNIPESSGGTPATNRHTNDGGNQSVSETVSVLVGTGSGGGSSTGGGGGTGGATAGGSGDGGDLGDEGLQGATE